MSHHTKSVTQACAPININLQNLGNNPTDETIGISVAKHLRAEVGQSHARASAFNYFFIFGSKASSLVNQIVFSVAPCIANLHESVVLFLRCLVCRLRCLVCRLLVFWQESIAARWPASAQCRNHVHCSARLNFS